MKFTLDIWGLEITPDKNLTVRAGTEGSSLIQVNVFNSLPGASYNYEITRTDGAPFGAGELSISNSGEISADNTWTLLAPRTRHTITARVRAFAAGGEEEILDTVAIVVRPRALEIVSLDRGGYTFLAAGDGAGVLLGRVGGRYGEGAGDYEYIINSDALPLAVDENGVFYLTSTFNAAVGANIRATVMVRRGSEFAERALNFPPREVSLFVSPSSVLITTNTTGNTARVSLFIDLPAFFNFDGGNYRYALTSSVNFSNFSLVAVKKGIVDLELNSPFTVAQAEAEYKIVAVHTLAMRRLTATVKVRVVEPLAASVLPLSVSVRAGAAPGALATASASGGGGGYTYSLDGVPPSQITIDSSGGEIRFTSAFLQPENYTISIIAEDGEGRFAAAECVLAVSPAPFLLALPPSAMVRASSESGEIATAVASGGRQPYRYSLANAPAQLEINESGVLSLTSQFGVAAIYTVTVAAEDADDRRTEALLTLSVSDTPLLLVTPSSVLVTVLDVGVVLAAAEVDGGDRGASYRYELLPLEPAHAGKLSIPVGGGAIRLEKAFTTEQTGTAYFRIVAAGADVILTATLAAEVFPPLSGISLPATVTVTAGAQSALGLLATAVALGGSGNYVYSFASGSDDDAVRRIGINAVNGEINLTTESTDSGGANPFRGFGSAGRFTLVISAHDEYLNATVTQALIVDVKPVLPVTGVMFPSILTVTLNTPRGTALATARPIGGSGLFHVFRLSRTRTSEPQHRVGPFEIYNGKTGTLRIAAPPGKEERLTLYLEVVEFYTSPATFYYHEFVVAVVDPDPLSLALPSSATVTTGVSSAVLATAKASGGLYNYSYDFSSRPTNIVEIDPDSGEIRLTGPFSQAGRFVFNVRARDDRSGNTVEKKITVVVDFPFTVTPSAVTITAGQSNILLAQAQALDDDGYFYTFRAPPTDIVLLGTRSGEIRLGNEAFSQPGRFRFIVRARNRLGLVVENNLDIVVRSGFALSRTAVTVTARQEGLSLAVVSDNGLDYSFSGAHPNLKIDGNGVIALTGYYRNPGRITVGIVGRSEGIIRGLEMLTLVVAPVPLEFSITPPNARINADTTPKSILHMHATGGDFSHPASEYRFRMSPSNSLANSLPIFPLGEVSETIKHSDGSTEGLARISIEEPIKLMGEYIFVVNVIVWADDIGQTGPPAAKLFTIFVEPKPESLPGLSLELLSSATVEQGQAGAVLAKAKASGGKGGYTFILESDAAPDGSPIIEINEKSGKIKVVSDSPVPGEHKFTAYARDKTGISVGRDFVVVVPINFAPSID